MVGLYAFPIFLSFESGVHLADDIFGSQILLPGHYWFLSAALLREVDILTALCFSVWRFLPISIHLIMPKDRFFIQKNSIRMN